MIIIVRCYAVRWYDNIRYGLIYLSIFFKFEIICFTKLWRLNVFANIWFGHYYHSKRYWVCSVVLRVARYISFLLVTKENYFLLLISLCYIHVFWYLWAMFAAICRFTRLKWRWEFGMVVLYVCVCNTKDVCVCVLIFIYPSIDRTTQW